MNILKIREARPGKGPVEYAITERGRAITYIPSGLERKAKIADIFFRNGEFNLRRSEDPHGKKIPISINGKDVNCQDAIAYPLNKGTKFKIGPVEYEVTEIEIEIKF